MVVGSVCYMPRSQPTAVTVDRSSPHGFGEPKETYAFGTVLRVPCVHRTIVELCSSYVVRAPHVDRTIIWLQVRSLVHSRPDGAFGGNV